MRLSLHTNTLLITLGSEIRRERKIVCLFVYIGKTNKQTNNTPPPTKRCAGLPIAEIIC